MRTQPPFEALHLALALLRALREPVKRIERHDRSLADQIRRASTRVAMTLGEGSGHTKGNARRYGEYTYGSAKETRVGIQAAEAWGYLDTATVQRLDAMADRLCALTYGLRR